MSLLIDIDTITIEWRHNSKTLHFYSFNSFYTNPMYTLNYTINNVKLSDAGQYTCTFFVDSANHPYILASNATMTSINISIST